MRLRHKMGTNPAIAYTWIEQKTLPTNKMERLWRSARHETRSEAVTANWKVTYQIERSGSTGISNMKVFCYDLMLACLWADRSASPGFLIHDSTIFDGVDERQRALALELAAKESLAHGFQYICTLNSDYVPWNEFSGGFSPEDYIRLRLTDADATGCLMGMRF